MFNGLISKSVIRDNIHILIPESVIDTEMLILISHGSSGIGNTEYSIAEYFLTKGYRVGLFDYFSKWSISHLWWSYHDNYTDEISICFKNILSAENLPYRDKIVHIGCSLGGFFGLLNSEKFYKNYCFYPGIIGFTEKLIKKDYSNTTVFEPLKDNWCNYKMFHNFCTTPPKRIKVDTYHGFMSPHKDRIVDIAKYQIPSFPISDVEFYNLKPSHIYLDFKYGFKKEKVRLKYSKEYAIICLNEIVKNL